MKKTREELLTKNIVVCAIAFICCALWGSAFPSIKIGYRLFNIGSNDTATQILFAGMRFTIAGAMAVLIFSVAERKILLPKRESLTNIVKLSMFQTVGQYIFFYVGLAHTTGVKASIIEAINVFCVIFISCIIFRVEKLTFYKLTGSVIGFLGVVLVNLAGNTTGLELNLIGDGGIFMSAVMYGFSSVYIKKYSKNENPIVLSAYQFLFGGIILMIIGFIFGGRITEFSLSALLMLMYLAFISAFAYSLWSVLLKYNEASKVAVYGFVNPICGVVLSALLLGEKDSVNIYCLIALIMVSIGIYLANKKE